MRFPGFYECPVCGQNVVGLMPYYSHFSDCIEKHKSRQEAAKEQVKARETLEAAINAYNQKMTELGIDEKAVFHIEGWVNT